MKPKIVSVLTSNRTLYKDISISNKYSADLLELRIDLMFNIYDSEKILKTILKVRKISNLPLIGTIRIKREGGNFNLSENKRLILFKTILPLLDYIDIEFKSKIINEVVNYASRKRKKIIISYHNFKNTPDLEYLKDIVKTATSFKPNIIKIATFIKKPDNFNILSQLLLNNRCALSIIPMTDNINLSTLRYLCYYLGSKLFYFSSSVSVAPGQNSIKTFHEIL